jgi:hypothetical protein
VSPCHRCWCTAVAAGLLCTLVVWAEPLVLEFPDCQRQSQQCRRTQDPPELQSSADPHEAQGTRHSSCCVHRSRHTTRKMRRSGQDMVLVSLWLRVQIQEGQRPQGSVKSRHVPRASLHPSAGQERGCLGAPAVPLTTYDPKHAASTSLWVTPSHTIPHQAAGV